MKRVLLTGGTGYIGLYMAEELNRNGYNVIITSRNRSESIAGYKNRYMELLEPSSIKGICSGIDIVIHMANLDERIITSHPMETFLANSFATRELYCDAVRNGVSHFVYLSTFHVYGLNEGKIDETTETNPKSDYGLSHLFAEKYLKQLVKKEQCQVSILRLTNGIGIPLNKVQKWYLVVNDFCRMAYFNQTIVMKSNGLPLRDFIAIKDVVQAIMLLVSRNGSIKNDYTIYNLSSENTYSIRDMAYIVKEIYEKRYGGKIEMKIPEVTQDEIDAVQPLIVVSQKIRALGWKPRISVEEIIEEIFDGLEQGAYE